MDVKQISVFVENYAGNLAQLTKLLSDNDIDMRALSIADTKDFGILRIIVNDSYKAACVLKDGGYVCNITSVLAVEMDDAPGSLNKILMLLGENGLNLEYTYAFNGRKAGKAYMILRVDETERTIEVLAKNGVKMIGQDDLKEL
jgi:hypothetical protein